MCFCAGRDCKKEMDCCWKWCSALIDDIGKICIVMVTHVRWQEIIY